jgi:DNA-binding helix-hairpin-helix protein with protein kinase domain
MIKHFYLSDGTSIKVDGDNPLGKGGEGTVYALPNNQDILLKIYSKRALERMDTIEDKVLTMTRKTPSL